MPAAEPVAPGAATPVRSAAWMAAVPPRPTSPREEAATVGRARLHSEAAGQAAADDRNLLRRRGGRFGPVVLRYRGSPLATGGTVDSSSVPGYTLHTFTTTGANAFNLISPVTTTLSGNLTGTGGFTLDTPSTLVLTGANTYAGDTIISNGVLQVGSGGTTGSLGSGSVTNNAALAFNRSDAISSPTSSPARARDPGRLRHAHALRCQHLFRQHDDLRRHTHRHDASLRATSPTAPSFRFAQAVDATFAAVVSGAGTVTKAARHLSLSTAQTYTGTTCVTAGRLSVNDALASTAVTVSGGTLGGSGASPGHGGRDRAERRSPPATASSRSRPEHQFAAADLRLRGRFPSCSATSPPPPISRSSTATRHRLGRPALLHRSEPQPRGLCRRLHDLRPLQLLGHLERRRVHLCRHAAGRRQPVQRRQPAWEIDYNSTTAGPNFTSDYVGRNFVTVTAVPEPTTLVLVAAAAGLAAIRRRRRA